MRETLNRLVALLLLVLLLSIFGAIVFSGRTTQIFDQVGSGIVSFVGLVITGAEIVFGTALLLGIAYGAVRIYQATRIQVIRDGKDGKVARAIVHSGQVHQMYSTMFDGLEQGDMQIKQLEYFDKAFKMMLQATKAADRIIDEEEYEEEEPLQIEAPKTRTLSEQIRNGQTLPDEDTSIVGYVDDDPIRGKLFADDGNMLDSIFITGDTGFGKSTLAVYLAGLNIYHHGRLLIIDPDAEFGQSLTKRLGPLANEIFLLAPVADTPEKAMRVLDIAEDEVDDPGNYPILLLIDEFTMIMRQATNGGKWQKVGKRLADVSENWATRGRKRRRKVVVMGQIPQRKRSGGTELRDSMTLICFRLKKKRAQVVLDIEESEIAPFLRPGEILVIPARSAEDSYQMQLPLPDNDGLQIIAESMINDCNAAPRGGSEYTKDFDDFEPEPDLNRSSRGLEPLPEPIMISPELAFKAKVRRVRELRKQRKNQSQIIETLYGVSKGGSPEYARARDEYISIMQIIATEDAEAQGGS